MIETVNPEYKILDDLYRLLRSLIAQEDWHLEHDYNSTDFDKMMVALCERRYEIHRRLAGMLDLDMMRHALLERLQAEQDEHVHIGTFYIAMTGEDGVQHGRAL